MWLSNKFISNDYTPHHTNANLFIYYVFGLVAITPVRHVFRNEQRYYELLLEKSKSSLCLFPYHLADIVTKGLRVTPFNYYIDVLCLLLKNDKSYDTLPNFTAADCKFVCGVLQMVLLKAYGHEKASNLTCQST